MNTVGLTGLKLNSMIRRKYCTDASFVFQGNGPALLGFVFRIFDSWDFYRFESVKTVPESFPFFHHLQNGHMQACIPVKTQLINVNSPRFG